MGKVVYVIENLSLSCKAMSSTRVPTQKSLYSILSSTLIHDKFIIQRTSSFEETVLFLVMMTKWIKRSLERKSITIKPSSASIFELSEQPERSIAAMHLDDNQVVEGISTFQTFSKNHGRRSGLTLRDIYCSQLCCIHSISPEKAKAIAAKYPTLQRYR